MLPRGMPSKVHSFSVFDTCLAGIYARPTDLLFALAGRVLPGQASAVPEGQPHAQPSGLPDREDHHEFVRLRIQAQATAQRVLKQEVVTLNQVYRHFPVDNPWKLDPEHLAASEEDSVIASARPIPGILEQVRRLIQRGERVVYITDSLLPGPVLRRLLEAHGFAGEVYAAGEVGKAKHSGALFRHVLAVEGLEPGGLIHCGGDPVGDDRVPRSMGIRVEPFIDARLTPFEADLVSLHRDCQPAQSRAVAACRLARLRAEVPAELAGLRALAADVVAPVLTAFVAWVLEEAGRAGARKVYFLAREGQILHRLAQVLSPAMNGPEPRYLMGSLAAWVAPGLAGLDRADLEWLAGEGQSRQPAELLAKLSLTAEELLTASGRSLPELLSGAPLTADGLESLWSLLDSEGSKRLLAVKAAKAKALLLEYLEQEGALDSPVLAVADMGWTLSTQRALRRTLEGRSVDILGLYFGLNTRRLARMEAGPHRALFIERAVQAVPGSLDTLLFKNVPVLTRIFTRASHGRVLGYERRGGAVLPVLGPPPSAASHIREVQETVLAYARGLLDGGWSEAAGRALRENAEESLRRFLGSPGRDMARAVAEFPARKGQSPPLVRALGARDLAMAWLSDRLAGGLQASDPPLWLEGSMAVSPRLFQPFLRNRRLLRSLQEYLRGENRAAHRAFQARQ